MQKRIALIHALADSIAPINEEMLKHWPDAMRMNLLDDSLSADLLRMDNAEATSEVVMAAMTRRFIALAEYAINTKVDGILFTCSAFAPAIEAVKQHFGFIPILKPNEAMINEAKHAAEPIGLIASFAPTLTSMPSEFPSEIVIKCQLAEGALQSLQAGDEVAHDEAVLKAAEKLLLKGCKTIALAQFSIARAAPVITQKTGLPVLTTPASAVFALKKLIA